MKLSALIALLCFSSLSRAADLHSGQLTLHAMHPYLVSKKRTWPLAVHNFNWMSRDWLYRLKGQAVHVLGTEKDGALEFAKGPNGGILFRLHGRSIQITPTHLIHQGPIENINPDDEPWMRIPVDSGKSVRIYLTGHLANSVRFRTFCHQLPESSFCIARGIPLSAEALQVSYVTGATNLRKTQGLPQPIVILGNLIRAENQGEFLFQSASGELYQIEAAASSKDLLKLKGHELVVATSETLEGKLEIKSTTGVEANKRLSTIATCKRLTSF